MRLRFHSLAAHAAMAAVLVLAVGPFLGLLYYSTTDLSFTEPGREGSVVGSANYIRAAVDARFLSSIGRTFAYSVLAVVIEVGVGVTVALLLPTSHRLTMLIVPALVLPLTLSGVAAGLQWRLLLHGDFGPGLFILRSLGAFRQETILGDPSHALAAVILADVWQWSPFICLVAFVTRIGLSKELVMAARLDGAGAWRTTVDIVLPQLRQPLVACALFRFADAFRELDKVAVMTGGGPGSSTELVSLYLWNVSFAHGDLGYAAALSVALYAFTFIFVALSLKLTRPYVS